MVESVIARRVFEGKTRKDSKTEGVEYALSQSAYSTAGVFKGAAQVAITMNGHLTVTHGGGCYPRKSITNTRNDIVGQLETGTRMMHDDLAVIGPRRVGAGQTQHVHL